KDLLEASKSNFEKLNELINNLSEEEFNTEFDFSDDIKKKEAHWSRDKNIRDILVHLYEWHQLAINWINRNREGESVNFLPEPYSFKNYGEMNVKFWEKHQKTPYEKALTMVADSHRKVMKIIDTFTDEELFTKKHFSWTGTTSLGSYLISSTSSHYDWGIKKIKAHKKNIKK
ncbi:MAG: hypothetical protein CSA15_01410, partial [Candidatus Delongbacteria bacterium]